MLPCVSKFVSNLTLNPTPNLSELWGFDLFYDNSTGEWKVKRAPGSEQYYSLIEAELNNSNFSDDARNRLAHHLIYVKRDCECEYEILRDESLPFRGVKLGSHTFTLTEEENLGSKPKDQTSSSKPSEDETTTSSSSTPPANDVISDTSEGFKKLNVNSDK